MRFLARLLAFLLAVSPIGAATYYFSDCAAGGGGTIADPYCLDPGSNGVNDSVAFLFDGVGTEAGLGDTIVLCCGGTDGCEDGPTVCTYDLDCTGQISSPYYSGNYWITPDDDFDSNPITVRGLAEDEVWLTGDQLGSGTRGVWDGTRQDCAGADDDISYAFTAMGTQNGLGDLGNGGFIIEHLKFNRWGDGILLADGDNEASKASDWVLRDVEVSEIVSAVWGNTVGVGPPKRAGLCDGNGNTAASATAAGAWAFYRWGNLGDFTFENSVAHTICGFWHRNIVNDGGDSVVLVRNNEFYNIYTVSNDWGNYDWRLNRGQTITYSGNNIHDVYGGIGFEDHVRNVLIEDNTFACLGQYDVTERTWQACVTPINVCTSDYSRREGTCADITIRRNRFYGVRRDPDSANTPGWQWSGIDLNTDCRNVTQCKATDNPWEGCIGDGTGTINSGSNSAHYGCATGGSYTMLVENNQFWAVQQRAFSGRAFGRAAINLNSNYPHVIRHNTIYDCDYGIEVDNGAASGPVAHIITNNLVVQTVKGEECFVYHSGATITGNNCYGTSGAVFVEAGVSKTQAEFDGFNGNVSGATKFAICDNSLFCYQSDVTDEAQWRVHLAQGDVTNQDNPVATTHCAAHDIDLALRPFGNGCDIGADEAGVLTAPKRPQIPPRLKIPVQRIPLD